MSDPNTSVPPAPYTSALVLATLALLTILLIIPPMCWHFGNRNTGATALIAWVILMNLQSFINALLWPSDATGTWFDGAGLCDVEVKIQVASQVAFPASFACVLRALARVMDTERTTLCLTKAQRRRGYAVDLVWCVVLPLLQMPLHYIVQTNRYYIWAISGCVPGVNSSWVTVVLILLPPVLWTLVCAYYAVLIIHRLHRYRSTFNALLANSRTTKSRFLRLFLVCLLWILVSVPVQGYVLYRGLSVHHLAFNWAEIHAAWNQVELVPSNGMIMYDRYVWLGAGVAVFFFFGCGRDAVSMYRSSLLAIGLGRVIPGLKPGHRSRGSVAATVSSFGSKARLYFKRKAETSTWTTNSEGSRTTSGMDPLSPRKTEVMMVTISEDRPQKGMMQTFSGWFKAKVPSSTSPTEKPVHRHGSTLYLQAVTSQPKTTTSPPIGDAVQMHDITGQHIAVESDLLSGLPAPTLQQQHARTGSGDEALVRKESRQGGASAEMLPAKVYEAC